MVGSMEQHNVRGVKIKVKIAPVGIDARHSYLFKANKSGHVARIGQENEKCLSHCARAWPRDQMYFIFRAILSIRKGF